MAAFAVPSSGRALLPLAPVAAVTLPVSGGGAACAPFAVGGVAPFRRVADSPLKVCVLPYWPDRWGRAGDG